MSVQHFAESVAKRFLEAGMSDAYGVPVKLTKRQIKAYCQALSEKEHADEIEAAKDLLENAGYRVVKARKA